jgi:hypothetical protein
MFRSFKDELDRSDPEAGTAYRQLESLRLRLGKGDNLSPVKESPHVDSFYLGKLLQRLFGRKKAPS